MGNNDVLYQHYLHIGIFIKYESRCFINLSLVQEQYFINVNVKVYQGLKQDASLLPPTVQK